MTKSNDATSGTKPGPLIVSRNFSAPRELVFKAWSSADHIKRWFSPETYTVPEAKIDFRPNGVFAVCMLSPEGHGFWSRGTFLEISPPERLIFEFDVTIGDSRKFTAHTTVTFAREGNGTRMTVRQDYVIYDHAFMSSVEGAPEGWRTTLDKLEREVARIQAAASPAIAHATFVIERHFEAPPSAVFHALVDKDAKAKWFGGGEGYTVIERHMDVRPDGRERLRGRWANGVVTTFDATYYDIVPDERLIYAYEMSLDDRKISVSLATIVLGKTESGTRLEITEQGAYLDGNDDGSRERGTNYLMDRLGQSLQK
jgi:uncharacterized protein YndB with AHSA1/START domain